MKLWIDLSNAPHVLFFRRLIKEMKAGGHELLVTARKYGYLEDLIKQEGISAEIVGAHAGKDNYEKLLAYSDRVEKLSKVVHKFAPEKAVFKHSVEGARVAYGLGIPSVIVADNDQSDAQNNLAIPISNKCVVPKCIEEKIKKKYGAVEVSSFNGVSEYSNILGFVPDKSVLEKLKLPGEKLVTIRTGPLDAGYFNEKTQLEQYLTELSKEYTIAAFPRNDEDKKLFEKCNCKVFKNGVDFLSLVYYSDAFLGEGGTMTRESALLGTPTISCYPQALLEVDKLLISKGLMRHSREPKEIAQLIKGSSKANRREVAQRVLAEFEDPLVKVREALR